jgi:hypothetical protein
MIGASPSGSDPMVGERSPSTLSCWAARSRRTSRGGPGKMADGKRRRSLSRRR